LKFVFVKLKNRLMPIADYVAFANGLPVSSLTGTAVTAKNAWIRFIPRPVFPVTAKVAGPGRIRPENRNGNQAGTGLIAGSIAPYAGCLTGYFLPWLSFFISSFNLLIWSSILSSFSFDSGVGAAL